ncbi:hypothetical protein HH845_000417 [Escherichia coli]|nr:hypothetical protein [Escherichia coli]EFP9267622.1 hypothetical protein [Shigella flexneri]EFH1688277.1 hypothetical protein [Escherichia coli]EFH2453271.1 hypothetical protein [Escherichia coli]EFH2524445.1 hypothetical protein [Escherichia coli]
MRIPYTELCLIKEMTGLFFKPIFKYSTAVTKPSFNIYVNNIYSMKHKLIE